MGNSAQNQIEVGFKAKMGAETSFSYNFDLCLINNNNLNNVDVSTSSVMLSTKVKADPKNHSLVLASK